MEIPSIREIDIYSDNRGESLRLFDESDIESDRFENSYLLSVSNSKAGTIRGMHFQVEPSTGPKLLTITTGVAIDVAIDLRAQSPTFGTAFTVNLRASRPVVLKIPRGFAHGYQTLENNTSLLYWLNEEFVSESGAGYNPLSMCLRDFWPISEGLILSKNDLNSPGLELEELKIVHLV